MSEPQPLQGSIVDLPLLSANFPPEPIHELFRDNVVNTLHGLLESLHGLAVEGAEGIGKTTVLAQFVRAHKTTAFSLFISAANRLSSDPDMIRLDLAKQVYWALTGDNLQRKDYNTTLLKTLYSELHREAKRRKILFYFVIDGLEELVEAERQALLQQFVDILPTGHHYFRFLFSGDVSYFSGLIVNPFEAKSYPVTGFSIEEAQSIFSGLGLLPPQLKEICKLCGGAPGRLAVISRSIRIGTDPQKLIDDIVRYSPDFFSIDWKQVSEADDELKRILAVLALDPKPHNPQVLGEILNLDPAVVDAKLRSLTFITIDRESRHVHFASPGLRNFIAAKLSDKKKQVQILLIKRLAAAPDSSESLMDLPEYLEDAAKFKELLTLLTPEHILAVLERSQTLSKIEDITKRGFRSAKQLGRDNDLLRFAIQSSVVREFASSSVSVSEIEALAALGRDDDALALANNATLQEDRLQLLSAFANGMWLRGGKVDRHLTEQIKFIIERVDPRTIGNRVREIAEHLVCANPDLATALLDKVRPALPDDDDLDQIFLSLSLRALRDLKDERLRGEVVERFAGRHKDHGVQSSLKGLRVLSGRLSASAVIAEIETLELAQTKLNVLRAWCRINAMQVEADVVAEHALQLAIRTTANTLDASLLADLSLPLPFAPSETRRRDLIKSFDGLRGTAERLGPSIDYVRLQLSLASAEFVFDQVASEGRLMELVNYSAKVPDLSSRGEAFARLLVTLKILSGQKYLSFGHTLETQCFEELDGVVLLLILNTADQHAAVTGMISALARGFLSKALEYTSLANTEVRRDALATDIIESLVHRPIPEVNPDELIQVLATITQVNARDRSIALIMERFESESDVPEPTVDGLAPIISKVHSISDSVIACKSLVRALNLLRRHSNRDHTELLNSICAQLHNRWSSIDVGWTRIDAGFGIAKDLAPNGVQEANRFFAETEALKDNWRIAAQGPGSAYVACIRLAIRAFSGLIPKRLEMETDVKTLEALIDVLPSYGERALLWADSCMRASVAGRQDLAERVADEFLKPILEKIPLQDEAYRAKVLINTAPALYRVSSTTCLERLDTLSADDRDMALREIIRFLLSGRVPTDPQDQATVPNREVSYDTLVNVASLSARMNTDWMIYATARDVAEMFHSTRKHYSVNVPQREDIARRFAAVATERLPIQRQIQHNGFRIITFAQSLRMKEAKPNEWGPVIEDGRALENIADRAYVLETIALCLPNNMTAQRDTLMVEARGFVDQIPSELDQIERYVGFAEDMSGIDQKVCRDLIASAASVLTRTSEDAASQRRRLVDVAFRVDENVASALIDKFDDDESKIMARRQTKLLKIRKEIQDAEPEKAVSQVGPRDLSRFGWLMLTALNSGRMQHFHPNAVRDYLGVATDHRLRRSFPVLLWYVENAVTRFSKTDQAVAFLRPIFDATIVGAQLAGEIAGRTLTRLKAIKGQSNMLNLSRSLLVRPGSREEAKSEIAKWCEHNLGDFVKIADPYFNLGDLEWLQLIRTSKPSCEITVLTGRKGQPAGDLEDVYVGAWRKQFDQDPPNTRIAIIGQERGGQSPIHDRWIVCASAGLRLGTSLNSLGMTKDSEISEMSANDAEEKLSQIDQYLNREKTEHNGEKLRLLSFWL
jgi:hypothetical protein